MSNNVGKNFLNALLGSLSQTAEGDNDVVVKANFEIRMANPDRVAPITEKLEAKEEAREPQPQPPRTGVTTGVRAATRIPEAVIPQPIVTAMPTTAAPVAAGPRVEAATRQAQDYIPVDGEAPALVPHTPRIASDYNPEYQEQFDRYLRTRQFDQMYGAALHGFGAPSPRTPYSY